MVDNNSNYLYKLDRINIKVPVQVEGKIYIFNKNFNIFFSALDGRKGYMP